MRALLILAGLALIMLSASAVETCLDCEALANASSAQMFVISDDTTHTLDITLFYINTSASPSRQPVSDSMVIVEMYNSTGLSYIFKTYTDSEGKGTFDYSTWNKGCINFKVLYCPFCLPTSKECGFQECLKFAKMGNTSGYYENVVGTISANDDIPDGPGGNAAPVPLNYQQFKPQLDTESYCPPPPSLSETPALCLPLLIIFSLLAGSLYMTGRNPFAGFALGTPRVGKHIRYQARGRSMSQNIKSVIMSIAAAADEQKMVKNADGKMVRKGTLAKPRWFGFDNIRNIKDVVVGTAGRGGEAGKSGAAHTALAAGSARVRRPGIVQAFRDAARAQRGANVRMSGRLRGESQAGAYFREVGMNLGVVGLGLLNASWLGYVMGTFGLDRALAKAEKALTDSPRHHAAMHIADNEEFQRAAGRTVVPGENRLANLTGTRVERTLEDGSQIVVGRNARGEEVTIRRTSGGTEFLRVAVGGRTMEIQTDTVQIQGGRIVAARYQFTNAAGQVTRYVIENDHLSSIEQVVPVRAAEAGKPPTEVSILYRVGENGSLSVEGIRDQNGQIIQATREGGQITGVGAATIQRDDAGQVTGMSGIAIPREAITAMLQNDGRDASDATGITAMTSDRAMRDMLQAGRAGINNAYENTMTRYIEGQGLVDVTDHNLLRLEKQDRFSIRTLDADYTTASDRLSAEQLTQLRENAAPATAVTGSEAREIRSDMDHLRRVAGDIMESRSLLMQDFQQDGGRALRESNPQLYEDVTQMIRERSEVAQTFDSRLEQSGQSREVRAAAAAILNQVNLGYLDTAYAGEVERGRREFEQARPGDASSLTPRAGAYSDAVQAYRQAVASQTGVNIKAVDVDTPQARTFIQGRMQPAIDQLWRGQAGEISGARGEDATRVQQQVVDREQRQMSGIMGQRVQDRVSVAMASSTSLLSSDAATPGSLENSVGRTLLSLGTRLSNMPESVVLSQVSDALRSDPSISDHQQAMDIARDYLPRAREVARTFDQAARVTTTELSRSTPTYVRSSFDTALSDVPGRFRSATDANDFMVRATRTFGTLPPDAQPEQIDRAVGAFMGYYAQRYAANPGDNPLGLTSHQAYAGMIGNIGQPQMDVLSRIAGVAPPAPSGAAQPQQSYDAMDMRSITAATYGVYTGMREHGAELPQAAYDSALRGIRAFNGEQPDVQVRMEYEKERVAGPVRPQDASPMRQHELERHAVRELSRACAITSSYMQSPEMQGYEQARQEFRQRSGVDIGPYGRHRKKE